jgi:hypothetical protein
MVPVALLAADLPFDTVYVNMSTTEPDEAQPSFGWYVKVLLAPCRYRYPYFNWTIPGMLLGDSDVIVKGLPKFKQSTWI